MSPPRRSAGRQGKRAVHQAATASRTVSRVPYVHDLDNPRPMVPYRLPDGTIVQVDDSAAKGARVIDFSLGGGAIVKATRVIAEE